MTPLTNNQSNQREGSNSCQSIMQWPNQAKRWAISAIKIDQCLYLTQQDKTGKCHADMATAGSQYILLPCQQLQRLGRACSPPLASAILVGLAGALAHPVSPRCEAEGSSLWSRCWSWHRFPFVMADATGLSLWRPFRFTDCMSIGYWYTLITCYTPYLYYFIELNKLCLNLSLILLEIH